MIPLSKSMRILDSYIYSWVYPDAGSWDSVLCKFWSAEEYQITGLSATGWADNNLCRILAGDDPDDSMDIENQDASTLATPHVIQLHEVDPPKRKKRTTGAKPIKLPKAGLPTLSVPLDYHTPSSSELFPCLSPIARRAPRQGAQPTESEHASPPRPLDRRQLQTWRNSWSTEDLSLLVSVPHPGTSPSMDTPLPPSSPDSKNWPPSPGHLYSSGQSDYYTSQPPSHWQVPISTSSVRARYAPALPQSRTRSGTGRRGRYSVTSLVPPPAIARQGQFYGDCYEIAVPEHLSANTFFPNTPSSSSPSAPSALPPPPTRHEHQSPARNGSLSNSNSNSPASPSIEFCNMFYSEYEYVTKPTPRASRQASPRSRSLSHLQPPSVELGPYSPTVPSRDLEDSPPVVQ